MHPNVHGVLHVWVWMVCVALIECSVTVQNQGIIQNSYDVVNSTAVPASREVILNIIADAPHLESWTETVAVTTSNATVDFKIHVPYVEMSILQVGEMPSCMTTIKATTVLVDDFSASSLIQDDIDTFLGQIWKAMVVNTGVNSTLHSNVSILTTLVNRVDQIAARQINDSGPPIRRRMLLQSTDTSSCFTTGNMQCILAACGAGLTDQFSSDLFDICKTPDATLQIRNLTEDDYRNEMECLIAGACRARIQCSPPAGAGVGVDDVCQQAIITEIRADQAMVKRADQSQKLAFFQNFFQNATSLLTGYTNLSQILADQINIQDNNANATLTALQTQRELLGNMSLALDSIRSQTESMAGVVSDFTQSTMDLYEQHGALFLRVLNEVESLTTINANLKLVLQSSVLTAHESNALAQLHLVSQAQAAAMSNSIWNSIVRGLEELMVRSQAYTSLATQIQGLVLNREAEGGFRLWSETRGEAPRELSGPERYQRLVHTLFYWVADLNDTRRVTMDMFCDLQKFILDTDPRNSIAYIPNWFVSSTGGCVSIEGAAFLQLAMANMTFLQQNITTWFPLYFSECKCIVGTVEHRTTAPSAMDFVTFVPPTNASASPSDPSWRNGSSDPFFDVIDSLFDTTPEIVQTQAILNRASLFAFLGPGLCQRTDTLAATLFPWNVSYVPMKIVSPGFNPVLVLLDPLASDRSVCNPNPTQLELWVQPEVTSLNLGPPLPLVVYQHMLLAMNTFESTIQLGYTLSIGSLPSQCVVESSTQQFSTQNSSATSQKNSISLTNNDFYAKDSPFGYESHTATCPMTCLTSIPVFTLFDKRLVLDESVTIQGLTAVDSATVLDTRLFNVPLESIPWQLFLAGYSGCLRNSCPLLPNYLDPESGFVVGVQTAAASDLIAVFDGHTPGAEFREANPDDHKHTGYDQFLYDIPQRFFSTSSSLLAQRDKVTPLLYKAGVDTGVAKGINSVSAQRLDTLEGPVYQRPVVNFTEWNQYMEGDFHPDFHANMGAQLFRQRYRPTALTDVMPPLRPDMNRLPNYTSLACTGDRLAGSGGDATGLCGILDRWEMDFSLTRGTVRFYPRSYALQVVARIQAKQDNTSIPYAIRPASSDALGRQINRCPETITIDNKEADFSQLYFFYGFLPDFPRVVRINGSACDINTASNQTGAFEKTVRVAKAPAFGNSSVHEFSTVTVSFAGCPNQVLIVTVEAAIDAPDYGFAPKNTCLTWQAKPLTQSIEAVRTTISHIVEVKNDQLAIEIRNTGSKASEAPFDALDVATRGIKQALSAQYNATAHQILEVELNASIASMEAQRAAMNADLSQIHSLGTGMLALVATIKAQIQAEQLDSESVVAYMDQLAAIETKYRALIEQQRIIVAAFQQTINITRDLSRNLTAVSFVFANAPANFSWNDLGYMITMFGKMECPARLEDWKRAVYKSILDSFRCTDNNGWWVGLGCLNGQLTWVRYLILAFAWSLLSVSVLFFATRSQYGIRMCPKACKRNGAYNKALWATSTKSAPEVANYVRPIIVHSLVYIPGVIITAVVFA